MTNSKVLNTIGLGFGLIGVIFIFIWGPPQPTLNEGIGLGLEDNTQIDGSGKTVKQYNEEIKKKRKRYNVLSRIGLKLVFIGFLFQLFATWH